MIAEKLNSFCLRALRAKPVMTEAEIVNNALDVFRDEVVTSDVIARLRDLDTKGFMTRNTDGLGITTWTLTTLGEHKAKQLG